MHDHFYLFCTKQPFSKDPSTSVVRKNTVFFIKKHSLVITKAVPSVRIYKKTEYPFYNPAG